MASGRRDFSAVVLSLLLRLYPRSFREHFGDDMLALYDRRRRRRSAAPWPIRLRGAAGALLNSLAGAPLAWLDAGRAGLPGGRDPGENSMKNLLHEARVSARVLFKRQRSFTALSVLTLALGLGAATAIFSVVNGVLLAPLPFDQPERIVHLLEQPPNQGLGYFSGVNFVELRDRSEAFEALAAVSDYRAESVDLTGRPRPQRLRVLRVGEGYFESLGLRPVAGRTFLREEETPVNFADVLDSRERYVAARDAAEESGEPMADVELVAPEMPRVTVLSHGLWQQHFGGEAGAVGQFIELDLQRYEVIG
ncbi:MAG: ABC transporter permease, partial [Acidobacteriota bacterium]